MYAIVETGGKQYRVELGAEIEVDRLDVEPGQTIELGRVLLVAGDGEPAIGRPVVEGARVSAQVLRQDRADKIVVFKYRPKARQRTKKGHRQDITVVRIADIQLDGRSAAHDAEAERAEREAAREAAAEQARRAAEADRALAQRLAREADSEAPTDAGTVVTAEAPARRPRRPRAKSAQAGETPSAEPTETDTVPAADAAAGDPDEKQ